MHGPPLVGWMLVALCGLSGASCLPRIRRGGTRERRAALGNALTGLGMAAMAMPAPATWPGAARGLAVVFGAVAVLSLLLAREPGHRAHHAHHAVGAAAMAYMALAMTSGAGHGAMKGGHDPSGVPVLTGVLLVYFAVFAVGAAGRLLPAGRALPDVGTCEPSAVGKVGMAGEFGAACQVSMDIAMFAMLLTL